MTNNAPDYEDNLAFEPAKTAGSMETIIRDGKAEIKRLQSENQHVIWLKHRNEALDKDNKWLRFLLNIVRKND